ncbi:MAG TPA: amidohydrolase family protein, partial [Chloroflexota bacterium]|nr:amidohydrolase family protein [Chloroflexota bacterium]
RDAFDYMPGELNALRPRLRFDEQGILTDITFPGMPPAAPGTTPLSPPGSGSHYPGNSDMEARMADYAGLGIDQQIVLPQFTGWWSYLIEPKLACAIARSWNTAMLHLMELHPRRIFGVALVALQDVNQAIVELEWASERGFKAAVVDKVFPVREHSYGTPLGVHRELWPFFHRTEELGLPVYLHAVQHGHRMVNLMNYQMDGLDVFVPSEGEMTVASLITSGLLDECPGLRFIVAEMGTAHITRLAQRLDTAFHKKAGTAYQDDEGPSAGSRRSAASGPPKLVSPEVAREKNTLPPSEYFRRNFYWTIETEEPELPETIRQFGAGRLLFATDYPHDDPGGTMKFRDVELLDNNAGISEADKELIRAGNARALFQLQPLRA